MGKRHGNSQRYSKTYRGNISFRETIFESDPTLKISFSTWRVLNKSNSTACDSNGKWMHDYLSVCAQAGVSEGSGEGSAEAGSRAHGKAESYLCLNDGWRA